MTSNKIGYLNSKLMLRRYSPFNLLACALCLKYIYSNKLYSSVGPNDIRFVWSKLDAMIRHCVTLHQLSDDMYVTSGGGKWECFCLV